MIAAKYTSDPEIINTLLKAGANGKAKVSTSKDDPENSWPAFDYAQHNEKLKGTDAYWKPNDARY